MLDNEQTVNVQTTVYIPSSALVSLCDDKLNRWLQDAFYYSTEIRLARSLKMLAENMAEVPISVSDYERLLHN